MDADTAPIERDLGRRRTWPFVVLVGLGLLVLVAATLWSAVEYNVLEEQLGEGEAGGASVPVALTGAVRGSLILLGGSGLFIAWLERRR